MPASPRPSTAPNPPATATPRSHGAPATRLLRWLAGSPVRLAATLFPIRAPHRRVSRHVLLEVQRALLPAGREREWVARHAAEFCAWMNPRFSIVPHDGDVSAEELLALVPARFRAR